MSGSSRTVTVRFLRNCPFLGVSYKMGRDGHIQSAAEGGHDVRIGRWTLRTNRTADTLDESDGEHYVRIRCRATYESDAGRPWMTIAAALLRRVGLDQYPEVTPA